VFLFIPDTDTADGRFQLLSDFTATPRTYRITLQENDRTVFEGPNNTVIDIPEGSLLTKSGKEVKGEVKAELNEFSNNRVDLLYAPSAIYEGRLIDYTRVLYLRFSQNNEDLVISSPLIIYFKSSDTEALQETYRFSGKQSAEGVYWNIYEGLMNGPEKGEWTISVNETIKTIHGYAISVSGTDNWYCLAKKVAGIGGETSEICVTVMDELPEDGSMTFFVSDKSRSAIRLASRNQGTSPYCLNVLTEYTPLPGKIIHISDTGNQQYKFGMTNAILGMEQQISLIPKTTSKEEIIKVLKAL
jgi:hypothetical protein